MRLCCSENDNRNCGIVGFHILSAKLITRLRRRICYQFPSIFGHRKFFFQDMVSIQGRSRVLNSSRNFGGWNKTKNRGLVLRSDDANAAVRRSLSLHFRRRRRSRNGVEKKWLIDPEIDHSPQRSSPCTWGLASFSRWTATRGNCTDRTGAKIYRLTFTIDILIWCCGLYFS